MNHRKQNRISEVSIEVNTAAAGSQQDRRRRKSRRAKKATHQLTPGLSEHVDKELRKHASRKGKELFPRSWKLLNGHWQMICKLKMKMSHISGHVICRWSQDQSSLDVGHNLSERSKSDL